MEQVRRLEKAGGIDPRPCRLLEPDSEPKHFSKVSPKDRSRVIPAVLDESYCAGSTALRINIWLSETCTVAQRVTAMELLEADTELFGDLAG